MAVIRGHGVPEGAPGLTQATTEVSQCQRHANTRDLRVGIHGGQIGYSSLRRVKDQEESVSKVGQSFDAPDTRWITTTDIVDALTEDM